MATTAVNPAPAKGPHLIEEVSVPSGRFWSIKRGILAAALLAAIAMGASWWLYARQFETTDDAQVDGHFAQLSTRVSGTVVYVNPDAENDHYVTAGTVLMRLDPSDYQADLDHARAILDTKEAEAHSAGLQVSITQATAISRLHVAEAQEKAAVETVAEAEAVLDAAHRRVHQDTAVAEHVERDRVRYAALVEKREISRSFYDARETDAKTAADALAADQAAEAAALRRVAEAQRTVAQRQAEIDAASTAPQQISDARAQSASANGVLEQAHADVRTAELNLSYTTIIAPVSGVVGHKTVEVGNRIQPGQTLLTVVPIDDIWITANFKETQLRRMRAGEPVTVHVDSFGRDYQATVEDLAGASGPLFSLFPPENASGNYVKIVQRFPIRIHINPGQDPQHQLRPGMSVEAKVRVR
jgi:membrane fusion protein (multidrug efflux system)